MFTPRFQHYLLHSEAGKVSHALSAGSIVSAGELLAKLELKDPSKAGAWRKPRPEPMLGSRVMGIPCLEWLV